MEQLINKVLDTMTKAGLVEVEVPPAMYISQKKMWKNFLEKGRCCMRSAPFPRRDSF